MIKRELKVYFKSFLIWLIALLGLFLFVFLLYPSIISGETALLMEEMLKVFLWYIEKYVTIC